MKNKGKSKDDLIREKRMLEIEKELQEKYNTSISDIDKKRFKDNQTVKPKKTNYLMWYLTGTLTPILFTLIFISMFFLRVNIWVIVIYFVITFPLGNLAIILLIVRIFKDRRKIKEIAVTTLNSNYLIANFWLPNKKKISVPVVINKEGYDFNLGNETYLVDEEAVYFNEKKQPCSDYLAGIPNPIKYNFAKNINAFLNHIKKGNNPNDKPYYDEETGHIVDLSYSSTALQKMKKDRFFEEMHKDVGVDKNYMIIIGIMGGAMMLMLIAIIIISVV